MCCPICRIWTPCFNMAWTYHFSTCQPGQDSRNSRNEGAESGERSLEVVFVSGWLVEGISIVMRVPLKGWCLSLKMEILGYPYDSGKSLFQGMVYIEGLSWKIPLKRDDELGVPLWLRKPPNQDCEWNMISGNTGLVNTSFSYNGIYVTMLIDNSFIYIYIYICIRTTTWWFMPWIVSRLVHSSRKLTPLIWLVLGGPRQRLRHRRILRDQGNQNRSSTLEICCVDHEVAMETSRWHLPHLETVRR